MAKIFLLKCLLRYIDNRLKNSQKKRCKEERYIFINRTKPNQKRSSQKKCTGVFRFRPIDGQCLTIPSISAFWTLHIYAWFEPPADTSPNCKLDSSVELGCITEHFTVTQKLTCFVSCNPVVDVKWLFFIQVSQGGKALCTPSFSLKSCSISLIKAQETYQREMASQKHWGGQKHRVSGGNMKQSLASGRGFSDIQTYLVGFKQRSNVLQEPQQTTSIPSSNLWLCSSPWRRRWSLKEKSVREWMEAENESFWDRDRKWIKTRWKGGEEDGWHRELSEQIWLQVFLVDPVLRFSYNHALPFKGHKMTKREPDQNILFQHSGKLLSLKKKDLVTRNLQVPRLQNTGEDPYPGPGGLGN